MVTGYGRCGLGRCHSKVDGFSCSQKLVTHGYGVYEDSVTCKKGRAQVSYIYEKG